MRIPFLAEIARRRAREKRPRTRRNLFASLEKMRYVRFPWSLLVRSPEGGHRKAARTIAASPKDEGALCGFSLDRAVPESRVLGCAASLRASRLVSSLSLY
jgi:hypothetical protein